MFFCIVPIFTDQGLGEAVAAGMLTVFAVSLATTQLVGGVLADRVRPTVEQIEAELRAGETSTRKGVKKRTRRERENRQTEKLR